MAAARDEQAPPVADINAARSPGAARHRLACSVEITRVRGPDAAHLAEVQRHAIREVLAWAYAQHHQRNEHEQHEHVERAA